MPENRRRTFPSGATGGAKERGAVSVAVAAGLVFGVIVLAGVILLVLRRQGPQVPPPPSQEGLAYASQIDLTEPRLSAEANFLGQQVVHLNGKITNRGSKTVQQMKIRLFFRDLMNQVVLKEDHDLLGARTAPLAPGQTRKFQVLFDLIPDSWNRQIPQYQLVSLQVQ